MSVSLKLKKFVLRLLLPDTLAPDRLVGSILAREEAMAKDPAVKKRKAEISARMNRGMWPLQLGVIIGFASLSVVLGWLFFGVIPPLVFAVAFVASVTVFWRVTRA